MVNFQLRVYTSAPKGQSFYHPHPSRSYSRIGHLIWLTIELGDQPFELEQSREPFLFIGELGLTEEYVASLVLLGGRAGEPGHQKGSGVGTWSYGDAYFIPGRQKHGRKELSFSEGLLNKANVWCCYWSLPSPALTGTWYWQG